jgi:chemotaxis protein MotB
MARHKRGQGHGGHGEENAERWLLTYADMITLLMALFIMLHSMSQLDLKKFSQVASSVRAEFGGSGVLPGSQGVGDQSMHGVPAASLVPAMVPEGNADLRQTVNASLGKAKQGSGIEVSGDATEVRIRIPATQLLFPPGNANLTPEMYSILQRLEKGLRGSQVSMRIEGHTCNLPISNNQYRSNWELSADRARNIALYFIRHNVVSPDRIAFMGYADTRPRAANDNEAHRRSNRRVEIVLRRDGKPATPTAPQQPVGGENIMPPPINLLSGPLSVRMEGH